MSRKSLTSLLSRLGISRGRNTTRQRSQRPVRTRERLLSAVQRYEDLIGSTPLVDISSLASPKVGGVKVLGKCEFFNPGFSMKDRIVKNIFDKAEEAGLLRPGGTVVAASSGNTGAAVAMLAAMRGYKAVITTSPKCSDEKIATIKAYGAEIIVSPSGLS